MTALKVDMHIMQKEKKKDSNVTLTQNQHWETTWMVLHKTGSFLPGSSSAHTILYLGKMCIVLGHAYSDQLWMIKVENTVFSATEYVLNRFRKIIQFLNHSRTQYFTYQITSEKILKTRMGMFIEIFYFQGYSILREVHAFFK